MIIKKYRQQFEEYEAILVTLIVILKCTASGSKVLKIETILKSNEKISNNDKF